MRSSSKQLGFALPEKVIWFLLSICCCQSAVAIENASAKIAAHLEPFSKGLPCNNQPVLGCNPGNQSVASTGDLSTGYYLYVVLLDGNQQVGVAGATFGIGYDPSVNVVSWQLCADLEFQGGDPGISWPDSGAGAVVTWDSETNCQDTPSPADSLGGVAAVIGAFYVYAYDSGSFDLTQRNHVSPPDFSVSDCNAKVTNLAFPLHAGRVGFGVAEGYDPCLGIAAPPQGGFQPDGPSSEEIVVEFFSKVKTRTAGGGAGSLSI